jgi:hypothetical protein
MASPPESKVQLVAPIVAPEILLNRTTGSTQQAEQYLRHSLSCVRTEILRAFCTLPNRKRQEIFLPARNDL